MIKLVISVLLVAFVTGCAVTSSRTVVEFDGSQTDYSTLDTLKTGKACSKFVLLFSTERDSSVSSAAKNGEISKVKHVDQYEDRGFLDFTRSYCTVVYGN